MEELPLVSWALVAYIVVKDILPSILPQAFQVWNKQVSTEDRLFAIIEQNAKSNAEWTIAITKLTDTMSSFDARLARIESKCPLSD